MTARVIQGCFWPASQNCRRRSRRDGPPPPIQAKTVAVRSELRGRSQAAAPGPPAPALVRGRRVRPRLRLPHRWGGAAARHRRGVCGRGRAARAASSGGRPLPDAVRGKMEAALGADFSNVRVHVGPQAERIGAIAFTLGSDIYFAPGRYQPDTVYGRQLLGHELAHVVQQRAGRVRNPLGSGSRSFRTTPSKPKPTASANARQFRRAECSSARR